jgi:hypothetical protein
MFRIVNWQAFWAQAMSLSERMQVLLTALLPLVLGTFTLRTSVAIERDDRFVHTTSIHKWGFCLLDGRDVIALQSDGVMQIACAHRSTGRRFWFEGTARCNEEATRVEYTFQPWFGSTLDQIGEIVGDEVHLTQKTVWFAGKQVLRRATK